MPLLVAAATDQTGRTITMLSAGLIAVALGLTVLTIWYWRFTSPKRRARTLAPGQDHPAEVTRSDEAKPVESAEPSDHVKPSDWVELWVAGDPPESVESPDSAQPPARRDESPIGLDSGQWAVLTQAVMEEYLDS